MWVMWSFQLWPSVCHMFVFAHLGRSPRAAVLLMEVGSPNPRFLVRVDAASKLWIHMSLETRALSTLKFFCAWSKVGGAPDRHGVHAVHAKTDGISVWGLARFSMDLGANGHLHLSGASPNHGDGEEAPPSELSSWWLAGINLKTPKMWHVHRIGNRVAPGLAAFDLWWTMQTMQECEDFIQSLRT